MKGGVCIVGIGATEGGVLPSKTSLQLHHQAASLALHDAGLRKQDVDGLFSCGDDWTHPLQLAEYLGLRPGHVDSTQVGGASWELFVGHALAALQAGLCSVALLTYGSTARSELGRRRSDGAAVRGPAQYEAPYGLTIAGRFALAARRHMHEYGTTARQLAAVAVTAHQWAQLNPHALHYNRPLTYEDALRSRMIAEPLRQADCGVWTDGGGAVVLTTAERARDLPQKPVNVIGVGEAVSHLHLSQSSDLTDFVGHQSAQRAFGQAGITAKDVDVLQTSDTFTIMVLLGLEALGFCAPGESGRFVESGALAPGGVLPANTDGGALAAHNPGSRGIFLLIEAVRQLRGGAAGRQVPDARIAVCNGIGGYMSAAATVVLGT